MSKLNYNNIDVQRILNVLSELYDKFQICAFLSYSSLEQYYPELKEKLEDDPQLLQDITDHYELMKQFREKHIQINDEENEGNKAANEEEEEEFDEEGQGKEKEIAKKERTDLQGITEETSDETKKLAKSVRNFCRKYYRNEAFLNMAKNNTEQNEDIDIFTQKFQEVILPYYQKKTKMTLEEEESETHLSTVLRQKINDLKDQIKNKKAKYEKLKKDRELFKEECKKKIADIQSEIKRIKDSTTDELNEMGKKVNDELNRKKEENDKSLEGLRKEHEKVIEDFAESKKKDGEIEAANKDEYTKKENVLRGVIKEYDSLMEQDKKDICEKKKEKEQLNIVLTTTKTELDTVQNKYNVLVKNFLLTQQNNKDVDYSNKVKERSVEWIQAQFRGYWIRKTLRKKYKFLNVLRVPKIPPPEDDDKKKKKKK